MMFCVDIRERESGNTVETILETSDYDNAWDMVNQYDKGYGKGKEYLNLYPKNKYFADVFNDETR